MKGFALSCVKHGECNVYNFKIRIVATQNYKTFGGSLLKISQNGSKSSVNGHRKTAQKR